MMASLPTLSHVAMTDQESRNNGSGCGGTGREEENTDEDGLQ